MIGGHHQYTATIFYNVTWYMNKAATAAALSLQHRGDGRMHTSFVDSSLDSNIASVGTSGILIQASGMGGVVERTQVSIARTHITGNYVDGIGGALW